MTNTHKDNVYIQSIEASELYSHMTRESELKTEYIGMIPHSLELIKLHEVGLTTHSNKTSSKLLSDDIINVKFNSKVRSGDEIIKNLNKKIAEEDLDDEYKVKLEDFIDVIQEDDDQDKWQEVSNHDLRKILYQDGFIIDGIHYVVYKRSSSKSRTGQCLFIKQSLRQRMLDWSRMGLDFQQNEDVDLASLLAYESLVGSSIIDTVQIEADNILIVDDIVSKFNQVANVVKQNKDTGYLESVTQDTQIVNDLFDGQSLLESSYFPNEKGFMQLRNHMFKTAAFNTNIQQFLRDNCPKNVDYDEWQIEDMYGNKMCAKDIHMITTPNSLKVLKFSYLLGSDADMYKHWKVTVASEGNTFGVCMYEDNAGRGTDEDGDVLQQSSYQMINSLPLSKKEITELTTFEIKYIEKLKNDDDFFVNHMIGKANEMNSNEMLANLYDINKKIVNTKMFRDFRKAEINRHVTHVKRGKLRLVGNYAVMVGNPFEMLLHAIGQFDVKQDQSTLKANQMHTTMFDNNKEIVGFRNPHTSPSNVLVAQNVHNDLISRYFNFTDNIVAVNAISYPLQDTLSGSDYDGDTIALFNDETLLQASKMIQNDYHVCINEVEGQKVTYKLNAEDMSKIDNTLSMSQKHIGRVVNLGQEVMSLYWHKMASEGNTADLSDLMAHVDVMTVLSGIAIDMAKKLYDIDINKEVRHVGQVTGLKKKKPSFFKYISQSKTIRRRVESYDTAMDYLGLEMDKIPHANYRRNLAFTELLDKKDKRKGNRRQQKNIIDYVEEMSSKINQINVQEMDKEERFILLDNVYTYYEFFIQRMKVNENTMYAMLESLSNNKSVVATNLLNVLFNKHKEVFLQAFKLGD